jgi:AcrR family transcriptional regulator
MSNNDQPTAPHVTRRPGRPRSERATAAILRAAGELLDSRGLDGLSVDAIAARAGVSKATIYRWWPNKAAIVMDAVLNVTAPQIPFPDTGSVREDLRQQMRSVVRLFTKTATGRALVALIAQSQHDAVTATALHERFIAPRRTTAGDVLRRGIDRGELRPDLNVDTAIDTLYGPLYYRLLVSGDPLTPRYVDRVIDHIYPTLAA